MEPIRWGVIGLGFFGEKHCETIHDMPCCELSAVSTRRDGRLREIAERYGVARTYARYGDLLADPDLDIVSIVTHVDHHRDIAIEALQAGKNVFLEKPMAGTVADCDAILKAAENASGKFMVGHICRFDSRYSLAKNAVDAGRVGRIASMHSARNLPAHIGAEVLDKISPLMGDGVHDVDIMHWLVGERASSVYAQTLQVRDFAHPDVGWAMLRFPSGAIGVIETVWCLPDNSPFSIDARMEIIGTDGAIYVDCGNSGLTITDRGGSHRPDTAHWPNLHGVRVGAIRNELEYFAQCVRSHSDVSVVKPEDARWAVAVMAAAEESAASGRIVSLNASHEG